MSQDAAKIADVVGELVHGLQDLGRRLEQKLLSHVDSPTGNGTTTPRYQPGTAADGGAFSEQRTAPAAPEGEVVESPAERTTGTTDPESEQDALSTTQEAAVDSAEATDDDPPLPEVDDAQAGEEEDELVLCMESEGFVAAPAAAAAAGASMPMPVSAEGSTWCTAAGFVETVATSLAPCQQGPVPLMFVHFRVSPALGAPPPPPPPPVLHPLPLNPTVVGFIDALRQRCVSILAHVRAAHPAAAFPSAVYRTVATDVGGVQRPLIRGDHGLLHVVEWNLPVHAEARALVVGSLTLQLTSAAFLPRAPPAHRFDGQPPPPVVSVRLSAAQRSQRVELVLTVMDDDDDGAYSPMAAPLAAQLQLPGRTAYTVVDRAAGETLRANAPMAGRQVVYRTLEQEVALCELAAAVSYLRRTAGADAALALLCHPAHTALLRSHAVGPVTLDGLFQRALGMRRYSAWKAALLQAVAGGSVALRGLNGTAGGYRLRLTSVMPQTGGGVNLHVVNDLPVHWVMVHKGTGKVHRYKCCNFKPADVHLLPVLGDYGSRGALAYAELTDRGVGHGLASESGARACAAQLHCMLSPELAAAAGREAEPCKHCVRHYTSVVL